MASGVRLSSIRKTFKLSRVLLDSPTPDPVDSCIREKMHTLFHDPRMSDYQIYINFANHLPRKN